MKQEVQKALAENKQAVIIMRHAHRLPFQAGSLGNDVAITSEGKQLANRLGRQLASFPIHCIETSSVLRCMQTAQSIIDGIGRKLPIISSNLLGSPGPFIRDIKEAETQFLKHGDSKMLQRLVANKTVPGMRSFAAGMHKLLNFILLSKSRLRIMISHDSIMSLLCSFLFRSENITDYLPQFLEAIIISFNNKMVWCQFRGKSKQIKIRELMQ